MASPGSGVAMADHLSQIQGESETDATVARAGAEDIRKRRSNSASGVINGMAYGFGGLVEDSSADAVPEYPSLDATDVLDEPDQPQYASFTPASRAKPTSPSAVPNDPPPTRPAKPAPQQQPQQLKRPQQQQQQDTGARLRQRVGAHGSHASPPPPARPSMAAAGRSAGVAARSNVAASVPIIRTTTVTSTAGTVPTTHSKRTSYRTYEVPSRAGEDVGLQVNEPVYAAAYPDDDSDDDCDSGEVSELDKRRRSMLRLDLPTIKSPFPERHASVSVENLRRVGSQRLRSRAEARRSLRLGAADSGGNVDDVRVDHQAGKTAPQPTIVVPKVGQTLSVSDTDELRLRRKTLLKTCQTYTNERLRHECLEQSGFLFKRKYKSKLWNQRYFVLQEDRLVYYHTQDTSKPFAGMVAITPFTKVRRATAADQVNRLNSFFVFSPERAYCLSAETEAGAEAWLRVLTSKLRIKSPREITGLCLSGWLIKVKNGFARKRWCVLQDKVLLLSKNPSHAPSAEVFLTKAQISLFDPAHESDLEENEGLAQWPLCISTPRANHFFVARTREQRDRWAFFCGLANNTMPLGIGTPVERVTQELFGNPDSDWPPQDHEELSLETLSFSPSEILRPLTTLPSKELEVAAVQMWKSIQLYSSVVIAQEGIEYHIKLAQGIVSQCVKHPELRNELYCQLIRQTHNRPYPNSALTLQCWQLLALIIPVFMPSQALTRYLEFHLVRYSDESSDVGQFSDFCRLRLNRVVEKGPRTMPPSRAEILSVIQRLPSVERPAMSIPVFLANGHHYLASFDSSTSASELAEQICQVLGLRSPRVSGFALFSNDPQYPDSAVEHTIRDADKMCDVLSKWESLSHALRTGHLELSQVPRLSFRRRLCFADSDAGCTDVELALLAYQTNNEVVFGRYPVDQETAVRLAAFLAQLEWGDIDSLEDPDSMIMELSDRFLPEKFQIRAVAAFGSRKEQRKRTSHMDSAAMEQALVDAWKAQANKQPVELARAYLATAREWPYYGAFVVPAEVPSQQDLLVWLAVSHNSVSILRFADFELMEEIEYLRLKHFGASAGDFRIIVADASSSAVSHQLLFHVDQKSEVTLLIASYINCIIRREGITCKAAQAHQLVWDAETEQDQSGKSLLVYGRTVPVKAR